MSKTPWGGSECLWSESALYLRGRGHRVAASVCRWQGRAPQIDRLRRAGVVVNERWTTLGRGQPKLVRRFAELSLRASSRLAMARWVDREKPDLICISNGGFDDNLALAQVCARGRTPYAVIAHANAECMWPDDEPARVLIDVYGRAQRAFFVSNANRELLEVQLGIRLPNAEVVWNPVGMRGTTVVPWPSASEPLQLACVARLHPKSKGQDLLLQVLAREVWRTRPVTVSFYGSGDNLESLQRLSRLLGVGDRVRFCGHTNDVDKVWKTHHALVLTSRYEGLPISLVEAMLAGRPAIVTDVGGNAEIVEHGVTGFVAAAPTVHHVATVMEEAWQQRNRWAAMGKDAAQRVARLLPANPAAAFSEKLLGLL